MAISDWKTIAQSTEGIAVSTAAISFVNKYVDSNVPRFMAYLAKTIGEDANISAANRLLAIITLQIIMIEEGRLGLINLFSADAQARNAMKNAAKVFWTVEKAILIAKADDTDLN